jgi:hypothetical protein
MTRIVCTSDLLWPRISRADLDFYEGYLINVTARAMAGVTKDGWDEFSAKTRSRWRNRALDLLYEILADPEVVERLPFLYKSLIDRLPTNSACFNLSVPQAIDDHSNLKQ